MRIEGWGGEIEVSDRTRGSVEGLGKLLQGATEPGRK